MRIHLGSMMPQGTGNDVTAVDKLNRATTISGVNRTYDILGNTLTIGSSKSISWDALNRMTSFTNGSTTTNYQYRADGMWTKKIEESTTDSYYYDGQMPIETAEVGSSSTVVTRNGLGARGIDRIEYDWLGLLKAFALVGRSIIHRLQQLFCVSLLQ